MAKPKLLIVDDSEMDRAILGDFFADDYDILEEDNGFDALITAVAHKDTLDGILLDVVMPSFNGFEVLQRIRKNNDLDHIPVILVTAEASLEKVRYGFQCGMQDFIMKPVDAKNIRRRVDDAINGYKNILSKRVSSIGSASSRSYYDLILDTLAEMFEFRGIETPAHIECIKGYTEAMLKYLAKQHPEYNIQMDKIPVIAEAAAFHDIGKLALPDSLLRKSEDEMTEDELSMMKEHTTRGCTILRCFQNDKNVEFIDYCCNICMFHHERATGQGYPRNLKGDDIPIEAQVVGIATAYDNLSRKDNNRASLAHEKAINDIKAGECGAFSTPILNALSNVSAEFYNIYKGIRREKN